ncbi:MAG: alpha/beta hydrolase [Clostridiales Family XIII bacterium]|jgi:pimeloyl-ACP methyl ester carboxylesterase|nr:alpha/beta hydrolase [Clostridiales Family XIII bacterium]
MNQLNADLSEIPLHELGHNFDSYRWAFEDEALANLKIYYYFSKTNEKLAVIKESQAFTGTEFKTYMKSYAERLNGTVNYDEAMANNVYSPYLLSYRLACIADTIGWEPFKKTFRYFNELTPDRVPSTSIDKFNLFMTKLRDYDPSHRDVIGMFADMEKYLVRKKLAPDSSKRIEYTKRAIIVMPGGMGSRLRYRSNQIWEPDGIKIPDVVFSLVDKLSCDETGTPLETITVVNDGRGTEDTYKDMYSLLTVAFEPRYDVVFFPYDWRLTNAKTGSNVAALETLAENYDEIYIVAHSMGGILASSYAAKHSQNKVKLHKLITIGTPYLGSVKAISVLETGEILDSVWDNAIKIQMKKLSANFASAYELFPNSRYSSSYLQPNTASATSYTYSQATNFLKQRPWALTDSGAVKPFFAQAASVHSNLMLSGDHIANSIPHYYIAGMGLNTPVTAVYDDQSFDCLKYEAKGDGTVLGESAKNGSSYNTSIISVNKVGHQALMSNTAVIDYVKAILNETYSPTQSAQIGLLQSQSAAETMGDADDRSVAVVIESNCELNIVDSNGNTVLENGEDLYIKDEAGLSHSVGTAWWINPETNRRQYIFSSGQYTITLSSPEQTIGTVKITAMCQDADTVTSFEKYDSFNVVDKAVIVANPDSITVSISVNDENSGNIQNVTVEPSKRMTPKELQVFNGDI